MKLLKMKYNHYYKYFFLILINLLIIFASSLTRANIDSNMKDITSKLRCMTCQNQTIYSSDADFSMDIKRIVKDKLRKNESEKEIIDFLIARYGEYIIFEPRINKQNIFLWLFPFVILAVCLVFLTFRMKKNT